MAPRRRRPSEDDPYDFPEERVTLGDFDGRKSQCSPDEVPEVRLALEKTRCLRAGRGERLTTPRAITLFLQKHYGCQAQENFLAVGLNPRSECLGVLEVATGGLDSMSVDPRVLFSGLILMGASAFVVCHNHPSGDPYPSSADVDLTKQLMRSAELLVIRMLDHVIISSSGETYSMMEHGLMLR